jgi:hypothetical protein
MLNPAANYAVFLILYIAMKLESLELSPVAIAYSAALIVDN